MARADQGENKRDKGQSMIDLYKMKIANEKAELVYAVLEEIEKVLVLTRSFTEKMGDVSKIEAVHANLDVINTCVANLSEFQKIDGFKSEIQKLVGIITPLKTELLTLRDSMVSAKDTTITAKDSIMGVQAKVEAIKTELSGYNENFTNSLNAAKLSEQNAKQSEVNAKQSEANAKQSEINAKAVESKADEAIATAQTIQTLASGVTQSATKATQAATNAKASEQIAYTSQSNVQSIEAKMEAKFATMTSGKKTAVFLHKGEYDTSKYVELPFDLDGKKRTIGKVSDVITANLGYTDGELYFSALKSLYKINKDTKMLEKVFDYPAGAYYNFAARIGDKMFVFYIKPNNQSYYYHYIYEINLSNKRLEIKQNNASWLNADNLAFLGVHNGEIYFAIHSTAQKKPVWRYNVETSALTQVEIDLMVTHMVTQYYSFVYQGKFYIQIANRGEYFEGAVSARYDVAIFDPVANTIEYKQNMYNLSKEWSIGSLSLINGKVYGIVAHSRKSNVWGFDFTYNLETGEKTILDIKSQFEHHYYPKIFGDDYGWIYRFQVGKQEAENPSMTGVKALAELP